MTTTNRTPAETYHNIACAFSAANTALMMIGEAGQTALAMAANVDDPDVEQTAKVLASSMDILGDRLRITLEHLREAVMELHTAGHPPLVESPG